MFARNPDLHAKRFKKDKHFVLTDILARKFTKAYPQYGVTTRCKLNEVISMFNELMWNHVIENRDGVELPQNMGQILIATCDKSTKKNVNFAENMKKKRVTYHTNLKSDEYIAKILYYCDSRKYKYPNSDIWKFIGVRPFTRSVSHQFSERYHTYIQICKSIPITRYLASSKEYKPFNKMDTIKEKVSAFYDEFKID